VKIIRFLRRGALYLLAFASASRLRCAARTFALHELFRAWCCAIFSAPQRAAVGGTLPPSGVASSDFTTPERSLSISRSYGAPSARLCHAQSAGAAAAAPATRLWANIALLSDISALLLLRGTIACTPPLIFAAAHSPSREHHRWWR
jgi:hypothetical protein